MIDQQSCIDSPDDTIVTTETDTIIKIKREGEHPHGVDDEALCLRNGSHGRSEAGERMMIIWERMICH
ncbi:hypothetical protein BLNAU_6836 [Blattamonas nauphoetae]|uniref:Uncharacterized protein n=1 Tax=Blattamonas nauphoetae TaxID=2049346 RepID=A0ABQ9Y311_9EUKA|nr:hypothetical protein BLNAU_6836 [Blattamonas nauphoetae]